MTKLRLMFDSNTIDRNPRERPTPEARIPGCCSMACSGQRAYARAAFPGLGLFFELLVTIAVVMYRAFSDPVGALPATGDFVGRPNPSRVE
jgi:hypothetical protein